MSRLETLVPPLELCRQIPEGAFADSALVWVNGGVVKPRHITTYCTEHIYSGHPAPTLAEILEALARLELCPGIDLVVNIKGEVCGSVNAACRDVCFCGGSLATAALRLWLEIYGKETEGK